MQRLIVNADDFGLTRGVNRAVVELHAHGVLTSATLMARASASEEAIRLALKTPSLGIGCHIVLVDGEPVLPAAEIPTLVHKATGRFHPTLGGFLGRVLSGRIDAAEIQAEAAAQIAALCAHGLQLTHLDTHKHTHMLPTVLRAVLCAGRRAGISAVRNPFEPLWSRQATANAPWARRVEVSLLHHLESRFRRIVRQEGVATTDGAIGVLATGTLDAATLRSLLQHAPQGTWELVTHPGYQDAELLQIKTRLRESRDEERNALFALQQPAGLELVTFADLGRFGTPR